MDDEQTKTLQNLWVENRMLFDKSLLQLSTAGIGFTVTLASLVNKETLPAVCLYVAAFFFAVSCTACLGIFSRNASYIEDLLEGRKPSEIELRYNDKIARCGFLLGVALTLMAPLAGA